MLTFCCNKSTTTMGVCTSRPAAHTSTVDVPGLWFKVKYLNVVIYVLVKKPYAEITYGDIKVALRKQEGFPVAKQRLIFCGEKKDDNARVMQDKIFGADCLHLLLKS